MVSAFSAGNLCARPQRGERDEPEPLLQVEPVDLVDDAVDVERQVGPSLLDRSIVGEHLLAAVAAEKQVGDGESEIFDPLHRLVLRVSERCG